MKIGILTFHWATNYGAILQCYALQSYLEKCGHAVEIINYKPPINKILLRQYLRCPGAFTYSLSDWKDHFATQIKDFPLNHFRNKYLHLTERYHSSADVSKSTAEYDIVISGSDQVLNPNFTKCGEGKKTSAYFLNFPDKVLKIGYAVSFGCEEYPVSTIPEVKSWIQNFDRIGVRESTGFDILKQMSYMKDRQLVPDPTLLLGSDIFQELGIDTVKSSYTYVYMLRGDSLCESFTKQHKRPIRYAGQSVLKTSVTRWLKDICGASYMVTNSYHGMIMAILSHVPFVVIPEQGSLSGMNDRFITLLSRLELSDRIVDNTAGSIERGLNSQIDWDEVEKKISNFRIIGKRFLTF